MKTHFKILILTITLLTTKVYGCDLEGETFVYSGDGYIYTVDNPPSGLPILEVSPAGAGTTEYLGGNRIKVYWNNAWFSGCTNTARLIAKYQSCTTSITVTIQASPQWGPTPIGGPNFIAPSASWVNELPVVTYTAHVNCHYGVTWQVPSNWTILSGQNTTQIEVMADPSVCSGTVTAVATGFTSQMTNSRSLNVSLAPLSRGSISNGFNTVTNNHNILDICEGDDLFIDASTSTFCQSNTNILVDVYDCDANWNNLSPTFSKWLFPADYNSIGGLSKLDMNAYLNKWFSSKDFLSSPTGNYRIKIAVGGGSNWNERAYSVHVNPPTGAAPPQPHFWKNLTVGIDPANLELIWAGATNKSYEIIYEHADDASCSFQTAVTRKFIACGPAVAHPIYSGHVKTNVSVPRGHCFRFKVRECCGKWSAWSSASQTFKRGETSGISDRPASGVSISAFPNPFSDIINLKMELPENMSGTLNIYDVTGKLVKTVDEETSFMKGENNLQINTNDLLPGLYNIVFKTDSGVHSARVVRSK